MTHLLQYPSIVLLILCSAFFSGTEMAFSSVNTSRLKARAENRGLGARLATRIVERYNEFLAAVLIGNNIVNTAASSIATVIVLELLGDGYAWVSTVVMTLLVLLFGEIIPKVLANQFPERLCCISSIPIYVMSIVLKPLLAVINLVVSLVSKIWSGSESDSDAVSEDDFENIIDIVEDEGVLDEDQCDLLQNALDFDEVLAYEIITPRVDMEALDIRDPYEINIKKILESTFSRIPVYEDTPDNIIGILHLNHAYKELIDSEKISIRKLLMPVTFVHKTMPLPDVLEKMKELKHHMVVVLDEYGGTMGILTMEDVMEQLVGEIWDETDEIEREFICIDDTHFEADGDMRIYDFFDEFDIDIEDDESFDDDNTTVGGWVTTMLDGEAEEGESFRFESLVITVKDAEERRVNRITVEIDEPEEDDD